jgi:hypothetical protein
MKANQAAIGGQTAQQRRGAADRGEYRQACLSFRGSRNQISGIDSSANTSLSASDQSSVVGALFRVVAIRCSTSAANGAAQ